MIERIRELSRRVEEAKATAVKAKEEKSKQHAILREKMNAKEEQLHRELAVLEYRVTFFNFVADR